MRPPTSPATVATPTTTARLRRPWLAPTAAAPRAVAPMTGTPAHDAATATNRARYCHQVPAMSIAASGCTPAMPGVSRTAPREPRPEVSRCRRRVGGARRHLTGSLGAGEKGDPDDGDEQADDGGTAVGGPALGQRLAVDDDAED